MYERALPQRRMTIEQNILPEFWNPPIIEAVLGVEFQPVAGWGVPHFGLFWQEIRADYPSFDVKLPLRNAPGGLAGEIGLAVVERPEVRCWFIDESQSRLLQLQDDRLVINWRKVRQEDAERYPKYTASRQIFEREWQRYHEFLKREGLGVPAVRACEVSYINHIEKGGVWRTFGDLHKVFTHWAPPTTETGLPSPDGVAVNMVYSLPKERLNLKLEIATAIRHADMKEVLQFTLTARGGPESSATEAVLNWLDRAHDVVAGAFKQLTTDQVRETWRGRREHGTI